MGLMHDLLLKHKELYQKRQARRGGNNFHWNEDLRISRELDAVAAQMTQRAKDLLAARMLTPLAEEAESEITCYLLFRSVGW